MYDTVLLQEKLAKSAAGGLLHCWGMAASTGAAGSGPVLLVRVAAAVPDRRSPRRARRLVRVETGVIGTLA